VLKPEGASAWRPSTTACSVSRRRASAQWIQLFEQTAQGHPLPAKRKHHAARTRPSHPRFVAFGSSLPSMRCCLGARRSVSSSLAHLPMEPEIYSESNLKSGNTIEVRHGGGLAAGGWAVELKRAQRGGAASRGDGRVAAGCGLASNGGWWLAAAAAVCISKFRRFAFSLRFVLPPF